MHIVRHHPTDHEREYLAWYKRLHHPGLSFDPASLVQAARAQWAHWPQLALAFMRCTRSWPESELYTHFLSPTERKNRWKFAANIPLAHPTLGTLLVDIIHDAAVPGGYSIGGIEHLDRVLGRHMPVEEFHALMQWSREENAKREARR
ncbi:MAG: hypothetical protein IPL52_08670 [Flavobacteriales bacterium]|nr:hypothetical protein [Flavobacteriales bacterium]